MAAGLLPAGRAPQGDRSRFRGYGRKCQQAPGYGPRRLRSPDLNRQSLSLKFLAYVGGVANFRKSKPRAKLAKLGHESKQSVIFVHFLTCFGKSVRHLPLKKMLGLLLSTPTLAFWGWPRARAGSSALVAGSLSMELLIPLERIERFPNGDCQIIRVRWVPSHQVKAQQLHIVGRSFAANPRDDNH